MARSLWYRLKARLFGQPERPNSRKIIVNLPHVDQSEAFIDNHISTTKYHWYSFLPKGLWEQFRRVANIYFLFHAILSLTPVSPVSPVTTVVPLVFVIGVAMLKELWEDIQRGRSDRETNFRRVAVMVPGGGERLAAVAPAGDEGGGGTQTVTRTWKTVQVGDIVRVEGDEFFPADLLCLKTSDVGGGCYVETMNLDGETNLKLRNAVEATRGMTTEELSHLSARIECEQPNVSIYTFVGNLILGKAGEGGRPAAKEGEEGEEGRDGEGEGERISLSPSQILLRGSRLKNTKYVYGVVVFTGFDTKIMMNATDPPSKRSIIEKRLDYIVIFQLILLLSMAGSTAVAFAFILRSRMPDQWYLEPGDTNMATGIGSAQFNWRNPAVAGVLQFFTGLVLYGYFVPISLYVSIEIVKLIQSKFINADRAMYYDEKDIGARARTSNLNEELGMIKTILSDKTGTLTRNQMDFFKCSIAGVSYGTGATEVERAAALRAGQEIEIEDEDEVYVPEKPLEKGFNMKDSRLDAMNWLKSTDSVTIRRFLEVLAVCHTVVTDGGNDPDTIKYMAESPDEAAFVVAAKRFGLFFHRREANEIAVREYGEESSVVAERKYVLLSTLEFSSARKRMSVVVRDPEGRLLLLCKGADNIILERLGGEVAAREYVEATAHHMREHAEAGLRTLAIAWKPLDEGSFLDWQVKWNSVKQDVTSAAMQAQRLEALAEELEQNLVLLGSTAIEDKLQVGVPQTIANLARAGIKLWVLTGDKLETAINIGYACSLLRPDMTQHLIHVEGSDSLHREAERLGKTVDEVAAEEVARQIRAGKAAAGRVRTFSGPDAAHALVIDGASLAHALGDAELRRAFLELAVECESVICCRVSPKQKALVTELVRTEGKQICLGVGDGANDVGMIQKANIGVGIAGEEGQQAVMASDFSIGQFRFLERLLLVHGGWSYRRIAFMVNFFFYKNFVYGFTVFYYNMFAQVSGSSVYYDWYLSLYNVIFSAFPVCVAACIDQDVKAIYRIRFPQLYRMGQENSRFTFLRFGLWIGNGIYQSLAIFFIVMAAYWLEADRSDGTMFDYLVVGTTMYTAIIFAICLIFALCVQYWTWIHHFSIWGSIMAWLLFATVLAALPGSVAGVAENLFFFVVSAPSFYLIVLLAMVVALLPDFTVRAFKRNYFPSDCDIVQEIERHEWMRRQHTIRPRRVEGTGGTQREVQMDDGREWRDTERAAQRVEGFREP